MRGHGRRRRGVLLRRRGSTGDGAAQLEKGQLPAQDPRSGDVRFSSRQSFSSSFVPAPLTDGLLKILTEKKKVESLSTSPWGPEGPPTIMASSARRLTPLQF